MLRPCEAGLQLSPVSRRGLQDKGEVKAVECTAALLHNIILMWHVSTLKLLSCPSLALLEVVTKAIRWHLTLHLANLSSSVNCVKFEVRLAGQLFPWSLPQITSINIFALVPPTVVCHSLSSDHHFLLVVMIIIHLYQIWLWKLLIVVRGSAYWSLPYQEAWHYNWLKHFNNFPDWNFSFSTVQSSSCPAAARQCLWPEVAAM